MRRLCVFYKRDKENENGDGCNLKEDYQYCNCVSLCKGCTDYINRRKTSMTAIEIEFAKVFRQAAEDYQKNSKSANLVEDYIIPALKKNGLEIVKS